MQKPTVYWIVFLTLLSISLFGQDSHVPQDSIVLRFVGGGDLQTLSKDLNDDAVANISMGFYLQRTFSQTKFLQDIEIDFGINVASTSDTIYGLQPSSTRGFGAYALNPINSNQSARVDMYTFFKDGLFGGKNLFNDLIDGLFLRFYGANKVWNNGIATNLSALFFRFGLFHEFIPDIKARNSESSVQLGLGYSIRGIFGDIVQDDGQNLRNFIQTDKNVYRGVDLFFSVKFKDIRAEFNLPFIISGDNEVKGLTNNQFFTTIRFVGGFPLKMN